MTTALISSAVIGLFIFALGLWISLRRLRLKTFFAGADDPLSFTTKLSRAHGNTVEFGPFLALLFLSVTSRHRRRPGFPVILAALWRACSSSAFQRPNFSAKAAPSRLVPSSRQAAGRARTPAAWSESVAVWQGAEAGGLTPARGPLRTLTDTLRAGRTLAGRDQCR